MSVRVYKMTWYLENWGGTSKTFHRVGFGPKTNNNLNALMPIESIQMSSMLGLEHIKLDTVGPIDNRPSPN